MNVQNTLEARVAAAVEHCLSATMIDSTLSELFREHHQRVLRAAYRITGSMADAEDVAQVVFARVAQSGGAQGEIANPKSYFYRAAINSALDLVRARQRENTVPLELVSDQGTTSAAEAADIRNWLRRAMGELDGRSAAMFAMRYLEDCELAEIAHTFNTSRAVVAVTLHRTRARLRKQFTEARRGK